ncbi:MAG: uncharacterized protein A8A55_3245 [Amphiamblys sp. WSBS2006]|nr:MAG: uncharacterized protein A8A55_3245 [Amphiamblys sp. WSBS2006]
MKLVLFVSGFFGCFAAAEDASGVSGDAGGKEEEQAACSFNEKGPSSSVGQERARRTALSTGLHGGVLPEQYAGLRVAADEDKTFDILEEIQEGKYAGKKLKMISKTGPSGSHEFVWKKKEIPMRVQMWNSNSRR